MSKTIELRKDVLKLLKTKHNSVFYRIAPATAIYPYIVVKIRDIYEAKELEVDYWDKDKTSERIETLADDIEKLLNEELINNENHTLIFYCNDDRKRVDDEDKKIQRINETFEIRYFGKE